MKTTQGIKFRRVAAGHYIDRVSGVEIKRDGAGTARFDRSSWFVMRGGETCRVEVTFAEAEIAAHKMIENDQK